MSDIYGTKHDWKGGESVQWGNAGLPSSAAATPFHCARCGVKFTHYYHQQPNIYKAIAEQGIDNSVCEAKP
jgi:hypothetical protein